MKVDRKYFIIFYKQWLCYYINIEWFSHNVQRNIKNTHTKTLIVIYTLISNVLPNNDLN